MGLHGQHVDCTPPSQDGSGLRLDAPSSRSGQKTSARRRLRAVLAAGCLPGAPFPPKTSSTVQTRSTIESSLIEPSTWTAPRRPGRPQSRNAHLAPRACIPRQNVSASRSLFPANESTSRRARSHSRASNLAKASFQMKSTSYTVPSALTQIRNNCRRRR